MNSSPSASVQIGIVVASNTHEDFYSQSVDAIWSQLNTWLPQADFELISLDDYPLPLIDCPTDAFTWWKEPSALAALSWVRKIQALDGYLFIPNGLIGYQILFNALKTIESELAYKPGDVIALGGTETEDSLDLFRAELIGLRNLPLSNGFELSEQEADLQREPFGDHFPKPYEIKIKRLLQDLADVAYALRDRPPLYR